MPYNPMPDDYRERIKIARERLDLTSGDQYELKVLREEIAKLEIENQGLRGKRFAFTEPDDAGPDFWDQEGRDHA